MTSNKRHLNIDRHVMRRRLLTSPPFSYTVHLSIQLLQDKIIILAISYQKGASISYKIQPSAISKRKGFSVAKEPLLAMKPRTLAAEFHQGSSRSRDILASIKLGAVQYFYFVLNRIIVLSNLSRRQPAF